MNNTLIEHVVKKTDILIIGAGAVGCAIARELTKYKLKVIVVDKNEDVGGDASKSNSAIIHTGYDASPGTLESELVVAANPMYDELTKDLDVPFLRIGGILPALNDEQFEKLPFLKEKAFKNHVYDVEYCTSEQLLEMEPNMNPKVKGGLYIPRESIIDPFLFVVALAENAQENGAAFLLNTQVTGIKTENGKVVGVQTTTGEIEATYIVNAAGLHCDDIAKMVGKNDYYVNPRKGQFYILDKNTSCKVNHIVLPIPTKLTKGKLICPTIHGNMLVGPTAEDLTDKYDKSTTAEGLETVRTDIINLIPNVNLRDTITQYSGLRPNRNPEGVHVDTYEDVGNYVNISGVRSTGLTASVSLAKYVAQALIGIGMPVEFNHQAQKGFIHDCRKSSILERRQYMYEINCDVAVIGGGPAGLAASIAAKKQGAKKVLIVERDSSLGGILQQCIHPGFGLTYFNEELTGPEYAGRFIDEAKALGVEVLLNSMVLEVSQDGSIICVNSTHGITYVKAKSIVLAMGCRERTRGNLQIPGTRPAGIYTAGAAQRLINRQNGMVGREIVILGSGDIGMIMARRMALEGAKVIAVVEIMDYLAGLTRNRVQCLDDFNIPLLLSHTVTKIEGNERVEGVRIARVDENKRPIKETEQFFKCDTLLLSVGLIPENELSNRAKVKIDQVTNGPIVNQYMQTSVPALFAGGNVVHVNDLADNVSHESAIAGREAARYAMGDIPVSLGKVDSEPGRNVRYICPQHIALTEQSTEIKLYFRVSSPDTNMRVIVSCNGKQLQNMKAVKVNPGEMQHVTVKSSELSIGSLVIDVIKEA